MLSAEQRASFDERGIVRLPGAVARVSQRRFATRCSPGSRRAASRPSRRLRASRSTRRSSRASRTRTASRRSGARACVSAIDEILGAGAWHVPKHAGQLLSMPYPLPGASWALPHKIWHLDYRAPGAVKSIPGLQLFLCVDRVEPRAGGTLVAAGTPRLVDAIRERAGPEWPGSSAEVRRALSHGVPWFRELCSLRAGEDRVARFMERSASFDGVSLQVVELAGEPGDVFVMHPWMVHNLSPNCGARPRLVLTERIRATRSPGEGPW